PTGDDKTRRLVQKVRSFLEQIKMGDRLRYQQLRLSARALDTENRDERRFSGRRVLSDRLSRLAGGALDIKQIVGDLEGETEARGVSAHGESTFGGPPAQSTLTD